MKKLNLRKMVLASLLFVFAIGTFSIVSCNKEEPSVTQNEAITKKSTLGGYDYLPDGKYYIEIRGIEMVLFITNGNLEKIVDKGTGEIIITEKAKFETFPGTKEGEKAAMNFIGSINDQYDCIKMHKGGIYQDGKEIGWQWVVIYGCD